MSKFTDAIEELGEQEVIAHLVARLLENASQDAVSKMDILGRVVGDTLSGDAQMPDTMRHREVTLMERVFAGVNLSYTLTTVMLDVD